MLRQPEKKGQSLEERLDEWESLYRHQHLRPPLRKKQIPDAWRVVPGGAQDDHPAGVTTAPAKITTGGFLCP